MRFRFLIGSIFFLVTLVACGASDAGDDLAVDEVRRARACGTRGARACPSNQFCDLGSSCDADDRGGFCRLKPTVCTREFRPVCGCDGETHSNKCGAAAAGASVKTTGACPAPSGQEGGQEGDECGPGRGCDDGLDCILPIEAQCGTADVTGTCRQRPTACTREFMPVCGCDGQTYSNSCQARANGASIRTSEACPPGDTGLVIPP